MTNANIHGQIGAMTNVLLTVISLFETHGLILINTVS